MRASRRGAPAASATPSPDALPLPVIYHDERLSSFRAEHATRDAPVRRRGAARRIDDLAASVILQSYLDQRDEMGAGSRRAEPGP